MQDTLNEILVALEMEVIDDPEREDPEYLEYYLGKHICVACAPNDDVARISICDAFLASAIEDPIRETVLRVKKHLQDK